MSSPSPNTATAEDYRNAFLALEPQMSETRRKLLSSHYHFYDHQGTMTQIAKAMGWPSYRNGNAHYGRLAKLVAEQLGLQFDGVNLNALCRFVEPEEPGDHWLIVMRPQVAQALEQLGWT